MNNYVLGMPTLIELNSLSDNVKLCKELNLNLLEINMNLPNFQLQELQGLETSHLDYSIHLPEDLNVWSFNSIVKNAHLETVLDTIKLSKKKNIKIINMHMNLGIHFTLPHTKIHLFEKYVDRFLENTISFGQRVHKELLGTNIHIYIENTGIYNYWFIQKAVEKLLLFDCFKLTWDVGHDYSSGNKDKEFLTKYKNLIHHLHLHDAIDKNNHLPLGSGSINLNTIFSLVGSKLKSIIFETKTAEGLINSVNYYREYMKKI